jgi:phosphoribosylformimino-5-aminoimidazole carboxamide ribotide isomerase
MIALRGWTEQTDRRAVEFSQEMERAGVRRIVFTDIGRDGTLEGPNLAALTEVARSVGIAVVASGGVGTLEDIQLLAARAPANVDSVIVGKALYAGGMSLRDALRAAAHGGLDGEQ